MGGSVHHVGDRQGTGGAGAQRASGGFQRTGSFHTRKRLGCKVKARVFKQVVVLPGKPTTHVDSK